MKLADTVRSHFRALGGAPVRPAPPVAVGIVERIAATQAEAAPLMERHSMQAPQAEPSNGPEQPQGPPAPANDFQAEHLTKQMLTLVEIAATQDRQIQALKARCERLERSEQAGMVAFTAFFHILDANEVSNLSAMAGVFGNLISQAQQLDLPEDCILYLRRIETMLRDQHADDRDVVQ